MYNYVIITKYNAILLAVDDPNDPDLLEILAQPWVISVKSWRVLEHYDENSEFKRLVRRKME